MTTPSRDPQTQADPAPLKRRGLLLGVGAAGAAVLAAKTMPGAVAPLAEAASTAAKAVDPSGGYQVSAHVLRYYETART